MFSNIGWGEIFFILVIGLIIIGPERLPGVVKDARAAIYAARKAINNAKKELDGELGEGFEEFRQPFNTVTEYAALGPRRAVAKVLFDENEDFLNEFDPRQVLGDGGTSQGMQSQGMQSQGMQPKRGGATPPTAQTQAPIQGPAQGSAPGSTRATPDSGGGSPEPGGFSWADIT